MPSARAARHPELSESQALRRIRALAEEGSEHLYSGHERAAKSAFENIIAVVEHLERQVAAGVHTNPHRNPGELVMFGNPPMRAGSRAVHHIEMSVQLVGIIGDQVHQLKYRHASDGEPYVHDFEHNDTALWAGITEHKQKMLVITNHDAPLWQDFQ